ncbi:MAG: tyrosine-type recombinase/integrase [Candidatus Hydrogenedentes bacterium]|nr:tyrosine-type recombinase/integrase [Candidatus Hydrogenedentota bacterium]
MVSTKPLFSLVQSFFEVAMPQRGWSRLTAMSYRDAIKLLLRYVMDRTGRPIVKLDVTDLTPEVVRAFLEHLETDRGNQVATRNTRLAALRSFFLYVAVEEPIFGEQCRRICTLPLKRAPLRTVPYLEPDEINALLAAPDRTARLGRFHHAIILFLYNTGARVAELVNVRAADLRLDALHGQVLLRGKRQKERLCPLWQNTVAVLRDHLAEVGIAPDADKRIFLNRRNEPLTRYGVNYILSTYVRKVTTCIPSIADKRISPHTIRHTTAVHLLNAGVDINVIRAWLGHVDVRTTSIYAEINLATKRQALELCAGRGVVRGKRPAWKKSPDVLTWLEAL